jgi:hypothetical protein
MSTGGLETQHGRLQDFTIDQFAGAFALSLGAVGTLLLVIWQSRCLCKCRLGLSDKCYLFDCERAPPPIDSDKKEKKDEENIDEENIEEVEEENIIPNKPISKTESKEKEPEPEPEPILNP